MPQPAPKKEQQLNRLASAEDMARDRFGNAEALAIVHKTTLDLAKHYAESYGLEPGDPEVSVLSAALAFARHKEFLLMQELERDMNKRVLSASERTDYGEVLFRTAKSGTYKEVNRELARLHARASVFHDELAALAKAHE